MSETKPLSNVAAPYGAIHAKQLAETVARPSTRAILNANRVAYFITGFVFGFGVGVIWIHWLVYL